MSASSLRRRGVDGIVVAHLEDGDAGGLSDRGLVWDEWGGDTVMVPVSAKTKLNLDLLLEMILLVADMRSLKANPARPAMGTVLEAKLDRARGPVATVLVSNGTLKVGDYFICGSVFGRVRAMFDDRGAPIREVGPSMPAEVLGFESLPEVGDAFQAVTDTAKAKQIVIYRESKARDVAMSKTNRITLEQFHDQLKEGEVKELNIILKTDVGGTADCRLDRILRVHAADDEGRYADRVERRFEVRVDEGAVGSLGRHRFTGERRRLGLEDMAGAIGAIGRAGLLRIVADVEDRQAFRAPDREQRRDRGFSAGIVARAPFRIVDGHLYVDDEERGVAGQAHRRPQRGSRSQTSKSSTTLGS